MFLYGAGDVFHGLQNDFPAVWSSTPASGREVLDGHLAMGPVPAAAHSRPAATDRWPACTARFSAPTHVAPLRPNGAARRRAPGGRRDKAARRSRRQPGSCQLRAAGRHAPDVQQMWPRKRQVAAAAYCSNLLLCTASTLCVRRTVSAQASLISTDEALKSGGQAGLFCGPGPGSVWCGGRTRMGVEPAAWPARRTGGL